VRDFKEFLKLLNSNNVEYLLIGGYAVGIYGYVRATNDLDIWISANAVNAAGIGSGDKLGPTQRKQEDHRAGEGSGGPGRFAALTVSQYGANRPLG
jgi:hypothetical protein